MSSSAPAACSSVRPSLPNSVCATWPTIATGSGGSSSDATVRPTAPPIRPSRIRSAEKPAVSGANDAIRIAEIAASLTNSSLPRNTSAAVMARITSTPICSGPLPIRKTSALATAMPIVTPPSSSKALLRRRP